jgi:hypothetical protein
MSKEDFERIQPTNNFERASRALPAEQEFIADTHAEMKSEALAGVLGKAVEAYKEVQMKIIELRNNFSKSTEDAAAVRKDNPAKANLLTLISRTIDADMVEHMKKKTMLEQEIQSAGGNPSDYTVQ